MYCLGNPVKFADPTGMQVLNPTYDVEGIYKYLPLPINVPEPSFDYIVTDNSWEEQAMATVRFNNAMYELNRVVTAGANNAMAFIGHDRDAAVQRALANAAVASAQADAAGKASESSWRGFWQAGVDGLQTLSYGLDAWGTACLVAAPFTEGASLPLSASFYIAGTITGLIGDFVNSGVMLYYDDNISGEIITFGVSVGFSLLMYNAPKAYKNELINVAEKNVKRFKTSMDLYTPYINSQVQRFNYAINGLGAALDKYFDTLNSYIPQIVK